MIQLKLKRILQKSSTHGSVMERGAERLPSSGLHASRGIRARPARPGRRQRQRLLLQAAAGGQTLHTDVAVVGAGIIGLCTSLALLRADPRLRVVLLDAKEPCAGG